MNKTIEQAAQKYFSIVRSLIPEKEEKPLVGLDIGSYGCRMVELKKKGASYELLNWAVVPLAQGDDKQVVKTILAKLTTPNASPATAISGKGCLIRFIDLPRMSTDDLRKSFAYEADKYFPFPRDQIYLDFFIIDPATKDNKMSVLVAAVKKELIDDRIRFLTDVGLQVRTISLNSIAVANAIHVLAAKETQAGGHASQAFAILDLGETVSSVTIMVGNLPRFNRDIFIGGRDFTRSLAHNLQVSTADAEALKLDPGDRREDLVQACESTVMDLVSELRLSFDYFVTDKNIPLTQVLLTGGSLAMGGFADVLAKHLEIPVKPWNPTTCLTLGPQVAVEELHRNADQLAVAIGLALYE